MLDCLAKGDRPTGKNLYNTVWENAQLSGRAKAKRVKCKSASDFSYALEIIEKRALDNKLPLIHIEAHGSENRDGIVMPNRDLVVWEKMAKPIQKTNIASGVNLMLVMASCYGLEAMWVAGVIGFKKAPFYALIGPKEKIYDRELELAFKEFYRELIFSLQINEALEAANSELTSVPRNIKILPIEDLWEFAFSNSTYTNRENRHRREELLTRLMQTKEISNLGVNSARRLVRKYDDYELMSQAVKRSYFCVDSFPENVERFNI